MPIPKGGRVRVKTTKSGKRIRLTFNKRGKVVETKRLKVKIGRKTRG
ncbi:hypothetical protein LCGC14_1476840 [marine sediment metagenome]|uniref:Uncharacterized protein n=1 Tax=marine sediment metagenome TaxID=412755 RepID=A0A0F9LR79_9ZZZZ